MNELIEHLQRQILVSALGMNKANDELEKNPKNMYYIGQRKYWQGVNNTSQEALDLLTTIIGTL